MAVTDSEPAHAGPDLSGADAATAFARLYDEVARPLHRYLALRVGEHAAYDLVSETFPVALRQRHSYDPSRAGARAWLFGIASNQVRQERRQLRAMTRAVSLDDQAEDGDEGRTADAWMRRRRSGAWCPRWPRCPNSTAICCYSPAWQG